jgi:(p)ppGpp synthase/HD superfamily hydrolase
MQRGQRLRGLVEDLPKSRRAIEYGERRHAGQCRSFDGGPFIGHPLEVGLLLRDAGAPDDVIAAGILHDTVEKGAADPVELRRRFGARVSVLVLALTEDDGISGYTERKAALRRQVAAAGRDALLIFAADKLSKLRELRRALARSQRAGRPPARSLLRPRRVTHYRRSVVMLDEQLGASALVDQLRIELGRLESLIATARAGAAAA